MKRRITVLVCFLLFMANVAFSQKRVSGKNITNEIYKASRLNRATSEIFGGGFRQIIFGVTMRI